MRCTICTPFATKVLVRNSKVWCDNCGRPISELELYQIKQAGPRPRLIGNSWERGIRRDSRGIPYLDANGSPLRLGEYFDPGKYNERPAIIKGKK